MLDESTVCAVDVTELKTERWVSLLECRASSCLPAVSFFFIRVPNHEQVQKEQWHLQAPARVSESAEQLHVTPLLVLMMKRPGLVVYKAAVTTVKKVVPICT
uniref:Uncharacterized protein n=1 Tax=Populus alba TaxID=43335 RepID=A0A4U5MNM1_POPAL|nr:hypothetical protein D5086_0000303200 [Populus alba]